MNLKEEEAVHEPKQRDLLLCLILSSSRSKGAPCPPLTDRRSVGISYLYCRQARLPPLLPPSHTTEPHHRATPPRAEAVSYVGKSFISLKWETLCWPWRRYCTSSSLFVALIWVTEATETVLLVLWVTTKGAKRLKNIRVKISEQIASINRYVPWSRRMTSSGGYLHDSENPHVSLLVALNPVQGSARPHHPCHNISAPAAGLHYMLQRTLLTLSGTILK